MPEADDGARTRTARLRLRQVPLALQTLSELYCKLSGTPYYPGTCAWLLSRRPSGTKYILPAEALISLALMPL
jgi:hypothetical protein